nr:unnamed protein product [Spirometra erinaceieuropaei]
MSSSAMVFDQRLFDTTSTFTGNYSALFRNQTDTQEIMLHVYERWNLIKRIFSTRRRILKFHCFVAF